MAAELKELKRLSEGSASAQATEEAERALLAFKEALCDYESLPPNTAVTSNSKGERKTAMQGYEYACILAAKNILKGESALERHVHLLSPFYWDYRYAIMKCILFEHLCSPFLVDRNLETHPKEVKFWD